MKTSNYIVTAFFVFIFGSMLFLFIAARGHKGDAYPGIMEVDQTSSDLADFSVIVVESNIHLTVNQSDSIRINFVYPKNKIKPENPCRISGDTLFIVQKEDVFNIVLNSSHLSSIVAEENCHLQLNGLQSDSLLVDANRSAVYFQDVNVNKIAIQADSAHVRLGQGNIAEFSARLRNKTELYFWGEIETVAIEKDASSRYYIDN
ncbi:hypothetical protein FACS189440_00850 [Bacteroidia bacterium]|nr:hypothetical protein FACS189440_00850 [Bacteroidia bacterium]